MNIGWRHYIVIFLALFAVLIGVNAVSDYIKPADKKVVREGLHAVFLVNGQVYFGEITDETEATLILNGIYYLKSNDKNEAGAANQSDVALLKLGNELHGPEDWMEINRQNILFIEKLKSDSKVGKAIENYKK